jgi:hypothetical protein
MYIRIATINFNLKAGDFYVKKERLGGCGGESQYEKDLKNGQRKFTTGEPKTKAEQKAYDNFQDWKREENAKKYSQ